MGAPLSLAEIIQEPHILITGEPYAGKSSLLYKLKGDKPLLITPTIGFICEKVERENLTMNVVEVGGTMVPSYAEQFYPNLRVLVYVVDASHPEKLVTCAADLEARLENEKLKGIPLLILANKNDVANIAPLEEIEEKLRVSDLSEGRVCVVRTVSAQTGDGIDDAVKWISENLPKETAPEPEPLETQE